jgi:hypothetical protein
MPVLPWESWLIVEVEMSRSPFSLRLFPLPLDLSLAVEPLKDHGVLRHVSASNSRPIKAGGGDLGWWGNH